MFNEGTVLDNGDTVFQDRPVIPVDYADRYLVSPFKGPGECACSVFRVIFRLDAIDPFPVPFICIDLVERNTGLPVLGVIPKRRGKLAKRAALTASDEPLGAFSEAINDVRTSIMLSQLDDPPKVVLLTSTLAGEGKTTLAANLSIAFSQRGRTLLLEADLRRGSLANALMVEDGPGLTDFVAGDCTLQDALLQINEIPNLFLMQGGTSPPNPIDVLSSHKFNLGLHNLRKAFDYIVIDSSPIMPVSDSAVLGNLADVVLLVIQSERTSQSAVKDALKRLSAARIRPIGAVLQQTDIKRSAGYGNYYGGYTNYYAPNRA